MADSPPPPPPSPLSPGWGENNSDELIRSLAAVTGLALVFLALRFFCKLRYAKGIGLDDALTALAWLCLVASSTLASLATRYGLGRHVFEAATLPTLPTANKFLFVSEFFSIIGLAAGKTSFCVTLLRLAIERWQQVLIWVCIITTNGFLLPVAITFFVGCTPLAKKWDPNVPGTCVDTKPITDFAVFAGAWSALTDFVLAAFPWFLVWKLQMRRLERIAVCVCMSMGALSGGFALVKTIFLPANLLDYTFKSTPLLVWAACELSIVIIASSIPFLRLLWKEIRAKTSSHSGTTRAGRGYGNGPGTYKLNTYAKMGSMSAAAAGGGGHQTHVRAGCERPDKTSDDDSDRSILAQSKYVNHILRTDEIRVESHAKNGGGRRSYEDV